MTLATVDKDGKPSTRTVLLKCVDERGFIFFTNYDSRKGRELAENPHAALTFFWSELERQVCVAGTVTKLPAAESEAYFKSRPRGSQHRRVGFQPKRSRCPTAPCWRPSGANWKRNFHRTFPCRRTGADIILKPERIEFWQGRPSRLHDRFSYTRQPDGAWKIERLAP